MMDAIDRLKRDEAIFRGLADVFARQDQELAHLRASLSAQPPTTSTLATDLEHEANACRAARLELERRASGHRDAAARKEGA